MSRTLHLILVLSLAWIYWPGFALGATSTVGQVDRSGRVISAVPDIARRQPRLDVSSQESLPQGQLVNRLGGTATAFAVRGERAYLGEGCGLDVLSIANPSAPFLLERRLFDGCVLDLASTPAALFLLIGRGDVHLLSLADPDHPQELSVYHSAGYPSAVVADLPYIYLLLSGTGIQVVDYTNPALPQARGMYSTFSYLRTLSVSGHYLYAVVDGGPVLIIDVADPAAPVLAGRFFTGTVEDMFMRDTVASGGLLYIANGYSGLRIANVSNPAAAFQVGYYFNGNRDFATHLALDGTRLYLIQSLGDSPTVQVLDVSQPSQPRLLSQPELGVADPSAIQAVGDRLYVLGSGSGLHIWDTSDPAALRFLGVYPGGGQPHRVVASGRRLYLLEGQAFTGFRRNALEIFDLTDPAAPRLLGVQDLPAPAIEVAVQGSLAAVAAGESGLRLIDISDSNRPREVSHLYELGAVYNIISVAVSGYLVLALDDTSLRVVDVSQPAAPIERGRLALYGPKRLAVSGHLAYISAGYGMGLAVVDFSNPADPQLAGSFSEPPGTNAFDSGLSLDGHYVYLTAEGTYTGTLHIVDVLTPTAPTLAGELVVKSSAVAAAGGMVYVTSSLTQTYAIDVSDPATPHLAGYYPASAGDIAAASGYVYQVDGNSGLTILRFAPPPQLNLPPGGGILNVPADRLAYSFPSGVFTGTVQLSHQASFYENPPPPGGLSGLGPDFTVTAVYTPSAGMAVPAHPYTLTVQYSGLPLGPLLPPAWGSTIGTGPPGS